MSQSTLVIYLNNDKLKEWLSLKAKNNPNKKSMSAVVASILEEKYQQDLQNNPLLKYVGALEGKLSKGDMSEFDQALDQIKKERKPKSPNYYKKMF
jgi:hypothetical protein